MVRLMIGESALSRLLIGFLLFSSKGEIVPRRLLSLLAVLALVLAACGGESTSEETGAPATGATQGGSDSESEPEPTTTPAVTATGGAEGTGTATVGDVTWEFQLLENDGRSVCMTDGILLVTMFGVEESGREVALSISGSATGGEVAVSVGDPTIVSERWVADKKVYDNLAGIDGMPEGVGATAEVDGTTVTGSGVFYEDRHLNEVRPTGGPYEAGVLEGTFSATCPAG
jgi:hypothetical protein